MEFHNTAAAVYPHRMTTAPTLMRRLRGSARLAAFMLVVFAMKIAIAGACARHDFNAIAGPSPGQQTSMMQAVVAANAVGDLPADTFGHSASSCNHCSTHNAAALVPTSTMFAVIMQRGLEGTSPGLPPSASPSLELRPPIA